MQKIITQQYDTSYLVLYKFLVSVHILINGILSGNYVIMTAITVYLKDISWKLKIKN